MADDPTIPSSTPRPPAWKRLRAYAVLFVIYAIVAVMAWFGIAHLLHAFTHNLTVDARLSQIFDAASLLFLPGLFAFYLLRAKLQTGKWFRPRVPNQAWQQAAARKRAYQTCATRPRQVSFLKILSVWANHHAYERSSTRAQRLTAWIILTLFVLGYLAIAAFGVIAIGAAFADDDTLTARLIFIAIGLLLFIFPARAAWFAISRRQTTGTFRAPHEDLQQLKDRRAAFHFHQTQLPLRTKITSTVVCLLTLTYWWLRVTVFHAHHPHETWFNPAISTAAGLYGLWIMFRKPKTSP